MKQVLILLGALLMLASGLSAQESVQHYNLGKNQLALEGYDPLSYFSGKKPQKGLKSLTYNHDGVTYWFSNHENRLEFTKNPSRYEPAYGGWCALAIAKNGEKIAVDPLNYKISDGRLLLFYKTAFYNALNGWNKEKASESDLLKEGDKYWQKIIKQ